jgi:hypothetical protein
MNFKNFHIKIYLLISLYILIIFPVGAQNQPDIPKPRGPVNLSDTSNLIIFIVLPLVIILAYLIFRKRIHRIKEEQNDLEAKDDKQEKD